MLLRTKRYVKRLISRSVGIEALAERTESQMALLREQISALREDVSNLSAAINNTSANVSLIYDCLIEFDREKRPKAD